MVNSSTNVNAVGRDWNGIIDLACVKNVTRKISWKECAIKQINGDKKVYILLFYANISNSN
jgi:hypothetical protein